MTKQRNKTTNPTHESTTTEAKTAPPPATGINPAKRLESAGGTCDEHDEQHHTLCMMLFRGFVRSPGNHSSAPRSQRCRIYNSGCKAPFMLCNRCRTTCTCAGDSGTEAFRPEISDLPLSLDRSCHHTFDDVFLAQQVEDDDRHDCQNQAAHHRAHIDRPIAALKVLDGD